MRHLAILVVSLCVCGCSSGPTQPTQNPSFEGTWQGHFRVTSCETNYPDARGCSLEELFGFDEYVVLTRDGAEIVGRFAGGSYFDGADLRGTPQNQRVVLSGRAATTDITTEIDVVVDLLGDGRIRIQAEETEDAFSALLQQRYATTRAAVGDSWTPR